MTPTLNISLLAYPTLTEAARLLGVSASTLSRRNDVVCERMGERDKRVPAGEVLRLAVVYRKRSLGEVAADLIGRARERSPRDAEHVQEEIEHALGGCVPHRGQTSFACRAVRAGAADLRRVRGQLASVGQRRSVASWRRCRPEGLNPLIRGASRKPSCRRTAIAFGRFAASIST
jgi:hypothetical protein